MGRGGVSALTRGRRRTTNASVADASNAEQPAQDPKSSRRRGPRHRTVRKTFRISAVWQPPPRGAPDDRDGERGPQAAGTSLSDEELVYGLITARDVFEARALDVTHTLDSAETQAVRAGVESITLEDVQPGGSVLAQLAFVVHVEGSAVAVVAGLAPAVMAAAAEALESVYRQPVAVSAVREHGGGAAATDTGAPRSGWDKVAPILGAIGTGIGVIGFVTFIGGVTVYARLRAAGFPAAPALGIFPSQDLVVIGAQTLVPEVLSALAAVILLGLVYAAFRGSQHITVDEENAQLARYGERSLRGRLVKARKRVSDEEAALLAGHATAFAAIGMFWLRRARAHLVDAPFRRRARQHASAVRAGSRLASPRCWPPPWAASRGASSTWPRRRSCS